jgi:lactoylglutathione lyase
MLRVKDLDKTLHFFCDLMGLVEVNRYNHEKGRFTLVFLSAPQDLELAKERKAPLIELTHNWDEENEYDGGRNFGHLAYRVEDLYGLCQKLMDNGVDILRPPSDGHMAFVKSPDGISIELLQAGDALEAQEPWASMPNQGSW